MRDGMQPGDRVLVYHSNAEPTGVAGIAEVAGAAKADPTQFDPKSEYYDPKSTREAPRWMMRELRFVGRFARVVTLEELKGCKALGAMAALQKGNRLSVTPVTKAEFDAVVRMAKGLPATPAAASRK
jgi:predicted RNA-binding protein with PUA-like domain